MVAVTPIIRVYPERVAQRCWDNATHFGVVNIMGRTGPRVHLRRYPRLTISLPILGNIRVRSCTRIVGQDVGGLLSPQGIIHV